MIPSYGMRLIAYSINNVWLGELPKASDIDVSFVDGGAGALKFNYAKKAIGYNLLANPIFIAVETIDADGDWVEEHNARFWVTNDEDDRTERNGMVSFSGILAGDWVLSRMLWYPGPTDGELPNERRFTQGTSGRIVRTGVSEALARGVGTKYGLSLGGFTNVVDSNGTPWELQLNIAYEVDTPLSTGLLNLVDQGLMIRAWDGLTLELYDQQSSGTDRAIGSNPVILQSGQNGQISESPVKRTLSDLATVVIVRGDDGKRVIVEDASAIQVFGRLEVPIDAGGVADDGTLQLLGEGYLQRVAQQRKEITHGLELARSRFVPRRDFFEGDFILSDTDGTPERFKVKQITLRRPGLTGKMTANVVLNDRLAELEERLVRRMNGILGGSTAGGGSGATPTDPKTGPDNTIPNAPTGLSISSQVYWDSSAKAWRAAVRANWVPPETNTDGSDINDLDRQQVYYRPKDTTEWETFAVVNPSTVSASRSNLMPNSWYEFYVEAIDQAQHVGASNIVDHQTALDNQPPPKLSVPTFSTMLGVPIPAWDGKTSSAGMPPTDLENIELWIGTTPTIPASPVIYDRRTALAGGFKPLSGFPRDTNLYGAIRGVDRGGLVGPWSNVSGAVQINDIPELIDAQLDIDDLYETVIPGVMSYAITADLRVRGGIGPPTPAEAVNAPEGAIWWEYTNTTPQRLIRSWRLLGGVWVSQNLDRSFLPLVDIGSGTFGDLDGIRIRARSLVSEALAVGRPGNLIPNGALEWGDLGNWGSYLNLSTDVPMTTVFADGVFNQVPATQHRLSVRTNAGQGTTSASLNMPIPVNEDEEFHFEFWAKADKAGSRLYLELRDQDGNHAFNSSPVAGANHAGGSDYPITNLELQTAWTKYEGILTLREPTKTRSVRVANIHWNHSNGTEQNAQQFICGLTMRSRSGGVLIQDGAIDAPKIRARAIQAQHFEAVVALISRLVSGDPDGVGAELTPDGFKAYDRDDATGNRFEVASLGQGEVDLLALRTQAGAKVGFDSDGVMASVGASIGSDPLIMGRMLMGAFADPTADDDSWMMDLPQGIVSAGSLQGDRVCPVGSYMGYGDIAFEAVDGRNYWVHQGPGVWSISSYTSGDRVTALHRWTFDGSQPSSQDPTILRGYKHFHPSSNGFFGMEWGMFHECSSTGVNVTNDSDTYILPPGPVRMLTVIQTTGVAVESKGGSLGAHMRVIDMGRKVDSSTNVNDGGVTSAPTKQIYRSYWEMSSHRTWNNIGQEGHAGSASKLVHGITSYSPSWGQRSSVGLFTSANSKKATKTLPGHTGVSISTALSGRTLKRAWVSLYCVETNYNRKGRLQLAQYAGTSLPSDSPSISPTVGADVKAGSWITVSVPTSWFNETGERGIALKTSDGSSSRFARYSGSGDSNGHRPRVILEYQ